jgi:hypothetical protein
MKKLSVFLLGAVLGLAIFPFVSSAAGAFYVDSSTGYVGIGNTTPASALDVAGAMYSRLANNTDTSTVTIDWNVGNVQQLALTTNSTLAFSNGKAGGEYSLILNQDGTGGRTVAWPSSVKWPGGTPPNLTSSASSTDIFKFVFDGTYYLGSSFLDETKSAISFDSGAGSSAGTASSLSWTHTVSGSNTILQVCLYSESTTLSAAPTYNGTSMTLVTSETENSNRHLYDYILVNPSNGSHTVSASFSGSGFVAGGSTSYDGALQSGQPDAYNGTTGGVGSTGLATSVTTATNNDWIIGCASSGGDMGQAYTGTNAFASAVREQPSIALGFFDTNSPVTPAGATTVGFSNSTADYSELIGVAIAPSN